QEANPRSLVLEHCDHPARKTAWPSHTRRNLRETGGMWNTWREPGIRVPTGPPTPSCHSRYHEWATICTRLTVPRTGMAGLLRLARPGNCAMSAAGVAIGGLVACHSDGWGGVAGR